MNNDNNKNKKSTKLLKPPIPPPKPPEPQAVIESWGYIDTIISENKKNKRR